MWSAMFIYGLVTFFTTDMAFTVVCAALTMILCGYNLDRTVEDWRRLRVREKLANSFQDEIERQRWDT